MGSFSQSSGSNEAIRETAEEYLNTQHIHKASHQLPLDETSLSPRLVSGCGCSVTCVGSACYGLGQALAGCTTNEVAHQQPSMYKVIPAVLTAHSRRKTMVLSGKDLSRLKWEPGRIEKGLGEAKGTSSSVNKRDYAAPSLKPITTQAAQ